MSRSVPRRRRFERLTPKASLIAVASAAVLVTGVLWAFPSQRPEFVRTATLPAFILFVVLADLLEVPLDRGRVFTLGLAPALAYALLPEEATTVGQAVFVFIAGSSLAICLRWLIRKTFNPSLTAARVLVVAAAAASYQAIAGLGNGFSFGKGSAYMSVPGLLAVLALVCVMEIALQSMLEADDGSAIWRLAREKAHEIGPLLLSSVSVAALLALSYPVLGAWTVPIFLAPLGATQFSFRQVATIRRNSLQTVRALAKVPEMAGYTEHGHSARVATLSIQIASELDVVAPELHDIEYAALLHDIGRISLPDPEQSSPSTARLELALVGAEIVENAGHFSRVAKMIGAQNEPYRRPGEDKNRSIPLGAKIIKVASAYDDLTEPPGPGRTPWDAIERLHSDMAYEYDPKVIQALTRVLEKIGLV